MKVIIAGSRFITDYDLLLETIKEADFDITEVVCGAANGVDSMGERYAKENNIKLSYFYADWKTLGKAAGIKRNEVMAGYSDGLIALWDGKSPGTKHMISYAKKKGLKVYVRNTSDCAVCLNKFFDI